MAREANLLITSVAVFFCCTPTFATLNLGPAININNTNTPISYDFPPQIALNDSNKAVIAWTELNGSVNNSYARTFDGTSWSEPSTNLNNNMLRQTHALRIAINNNSHAIAVWQEDSDTAWNIYTRIFDGTNWSTTASNLNYNSNNYAYEPQIAMNNNENAIAVWQEDSGTAWNIYTRIFDGTNWSTTASNLNYNSNNDAYEPQIAMDDDGRAIAIWAEYNGTAWNIYTRIFDGTNWSTTASNLNYEPNNYAHTPQIAMNNNGKAIAVWREDDGFTYNIYACTFDGTNWQTTSNLNYVPNNYAFAPQIAMNNNENAISVWQEYNGTAWNIYARIFDGTNWSTTASNLNYDFTQETDSPQIAMNNDGNAVAIWQESNNIYARTFDGTNWQTAKNLNNNPAMSSFNPQIALNNLNNPFVAWQEGPYNDSTRAFVRQAALPYTACQWLSAVSGSKQYMAASREDDLNRGHLDIYEYKPSTQTIEFKASTTLDHELARFAVYNKSDTDLQIAAIISMTPPHQQLQTFKFDGTSIQLTADLSSYVTDNCSDAQWWTTSATQSYLAVIGDTKLTILDLVNLANSASLDTAGAKLLWTLKDSYNGVVALNGPQATPYKVDLSTTPVTITAGTPLVAPTGFHFISLSTCGDYIAVGLTSTDTVSYGYTQVHILTWDTAANTLSFSGTHTTLAEQVYVSSMARCCCCATSRPLLVGSVGTSRNYNLNILAPDLSQLYASTLLGYYVMNVAWDCRGENVHLSATAYEDLNDFAYCCQYNFAPATGTLSYPAVLYH